MRARIATSVQPHEDCYFIKEQTEPDAVLNIPIRVQYIGVRRNGELAVCQEPIDTCENLDCKGFPPILVASPDPVPVEVARAEVEAMRRRQVTNPPPLTVTVNGESYVEVEHPALEVIPYGPLSPRPDDADAGRIYSFPG